MMFPHSLTPTNSEPCPEPTPYSIIHWTQGRLRLRIPQLGKEPNYAANLERSLTASSAITEVAFNESARSVTIHYDAHQLSPSQFREHLIMALQQAASPISEPYTTKALAQRLGVPFQTLNWRRSQVDFAVWSRSKDPQGIAWSYDSKAKCFHSCAAAPPEPATPESANSKVERIFQSLVGTTGGRLGGLLGKVAGEAIGLALLGTAGVIVGAEVGMMIGEIVGEELGSV